MVKDYDDLDHKIKKLVIHYQLDKPLKDHRGTWALIAKKLNYPGQEKYIRERWFNHINPIYRKNLSYDDKIEIIRIRSIIDSNNWTAIAKILKIAPNTIKNFWHGFTRCHGFEPIPRNKFMWLVICGCLKQQKITKY